MNEVRILENLSHENIVKFEAFHKTRNHLWIVLEYCTGGDILSLIDQDKQLPEHVIQNFGLDIMDGLFYLHSKGIIYADLKPSNILFNEYGVLKLCDFGLARLISDLQVEENKKGTPYYMAPELFEEGGVYSFYSDLWSFGCVLYELAVGTPPFISNTFKDLKEQIISADTPFIASASASFNDLIGGLLQKDPSKRIGWEEVLWHEFWMGKRLVQVHLPEHECYQKYLKDRGLIQRTMGNISNSHEYQARDSIRASFNGKEDFVIKSRDQVFNFGENWDIEEKHEEAKIIHQRSNSAALQTPAIKSPFKPQPIEQLLIHNSDLNIKPIISNYENLFEQIDPSIIKWNSESISEHVNSSELENHLSEVYSILSSNAQISVKTSYLAYLESLILDYPLANKLINSAFVQLFLKLFQSKSNELKGRVCSIFGQMLRHATIIDSDLPKLPVAESFVELVQGNFEVGIRRKALAALGEYLFYAATQMDEEEFDEAWTIDPVMVNILNQELLLNNDEVCRQYTVRTVENITAQSKNGGIIFATSELSCSLANTFLSSTSEELKLSSIIALSHILNLKKKLFADVSQILNTEILQQQIKEADERTQQALITIFNSAMQGREAPCVDILTLMPLLESPGIVIRGKTLLFFMFLLKSSTKCLLEMVQIKFFSVIDRLLKDNYTYVQCCLHHFLDVLTEKTMTIMKNATEGNYEFFHVLPGVLNSISGRLKLPFPNFIKLISNLILKDTPEANQMILEILETLVTKSQQLRAHAVIIITYLLPNLLEALSRNIDTRFRCLKIFSDITIPFMNDIEIFDCNDSNKYLTSSLNTVLLKKLMPLICGLLDDNDPIPLLSISLLSHIVEMCPFYIDAIRSHGLIPKLLIHFQDRDKQLNEHLLKIVKTIIEKADLAMEEISELHFIEKMNSVLRYVASKNWCIEITLEILRVLIHTLQVISKEKISSQVYLLVDSVLTCTELLKSDDDLISAQSANCLILLLQLLGNNLTQHLSTEHGKALLEILTYNKTSLQKLSIKILRGAVERLSIPDMMDKILPLRRHENEDIAKIAVEIQSILKGKAEYSHSR